MPTSTSTTTLVSLCKSQARQNEIKPINDELVESLFQWNSSFETCSRHQIVSAIIGVDEFHKGSPASRDKTERASSLRKTLVSVSVKDPRLSSSSSSSSGKNNNNKSNDKIVFHRTSQSFFDDSVARTLRLGPLSRLSQLAKENKLDPDTLRKRVHLALLSGFDQDNDFQLVRNLIVTGTPVSSSNNSSDDGGKSSSSSGSSADSIKNHIRILAFVSLLSSTSSSEDVCHTVRDVLSTLGQKSAKSLIEQAPTILNGLTLEMFAAQSGNTELLSLMMMKQTAEKSGNQSLSLSTLNDLLCFAIRSGSKKCVSLILEKYFASSSSASTTEKDSIERSSSESNNAADGDEQENTSSTSNGNSNNSSVSALHQKSAILLSPLQVACEVGNIEIISEIIKTSESSKNLKLMISSSCFPFFSPLYLAAKNSSTAVVSYLLEHHASFLVQLKQQEDEAIEKLSENSTSSSYDQEVGASPLHVAAMNGHIETFSILLLQHQLLTKMAILKVKSEKEKQQKLELYDSLLGTMTSKDPRTGKSPLHFAAIFNRTKIIEKAFSTSSANASVKQVRDPLDNHGNTPLIDACRVGAEEAVAALIQAGAARNLCNSEDGNAPLHEAALGNHVGCAELLLKKGADIDLLTLSSGKTALHLAAQCGYEEMIKTLLNFWKNNNNNTNDTNKNKKEEDSSSDDDENDGDILATKDEVTGRTALHFAVIGQHLSCIKLLLEYGADSSILDDKNQSPLHLACQTEAKDVITELLEDSKKHDQEEREKQVQERSLTPAQRRKLEEEAKESNNNNKEEHESDENTKKPSSPQQKQPSRSPSRQHSRSTSGALTGNHHNNTTSSSSSASAAALAKISSIRNIPQHDQSSSLNQAVLSGDPSVVRSVIEHSPYLSFEQIITALFVVVELNHVSLVDVLLNTPIGGAAPGNDNDNNNNQQQRAPSLPPAGGAGRASSVSFRSPSPLRPAAAATSHFHHQHVTPIRSILARSLPPLPPLPGSMPNNAHHQSQQQQQNQNQQGRSAVSSMTPARTLFQQQSLARSGISNNNTTGSRRVSRARSSAATNNTNNNGSSWIDVVAEDSRLNITSCLEVAVRFGHVKIAEKLLEHGASAEGSLFASLDLVGKDIISNNSNNVDTNNEENENKLSKGKMTQASPLREACARNDLDMVKILVDKGRAQFDKINNNTNLASTSASAAASSLSGGAMPIFDRVPFLIALYRQYTDLVSLLIRLGAAFDRPDHNERRPLHVAAGNGNAEICRFLLEAGADVHRPDLEGRTPLFEASFNGRAEVVKILVSAGASVERFDNAGNSMIHCAFRNGHYETTVALIWGSFVRDFDDAKRSSNNNNKSSHQHKPTSDGDAATPAADPRLRYRYAEPKLLEAALRGDGETVADMLQNSYNRVSADITTAGGWSALHLAAACGFEGIVKLLLNSGASVNRLDRLGRMPIHEAARSGFSKIVILLLSRGAFADAPDEKGQTPLVEATIHGHLDVISALTRIGQPNLDWGNCWTPVHEAAVKGNTKIVAAFIEAGVEVDVLDSSRRTPLTLAAMEGHVDTVKYLLSKKASLNGKGPDAEAASRSRGSILSGFVDVGSYFSSASSPKLPAATNNNNKTSSSTAAGESDQDSFHHSNSPLQYACYYGHVKVVDVLLSVGTDPDGDLPDNSFVKTALYYAASRGHSNCVASLLNTKKPSKIRVTESFATPLHAAAVGGYADICDMLFSYGFELDATTVAGWSALHLAAKNGHAAAVDALLKRGADPNKMDREGRNALRDAAKGGHTKIINLLLQSQRVAIDVRTNDGRSALHDAALAGHPETVRLLIRARAVVNRQDNQGYTPLFFAAAAGKKDVVDILMNDGGAQFSITTKLGQNPLHGAAAAGRSELVEFFLQQFARHLHEERHAREERERQQQEAEEEQRRKAETNNSTASEGAENASPSAASATTEQGNNDDNNNNNNNSINPSPAQQQPQQRLGQQASNSDPNIIDRADRGGKTPLYLAANYGQLDVVLLLIDYGADTTVTTSTGSTALHAACAGGYQDIAEILLEGGASPDTPTKIGITPLHVSSQSGQTDLVRLLLSFGANPGSIDKYGRTPLFFSVVHGHTYVLDLLLEEKEYVKENGESKNPDCIKIDYNTCTGTTALHVAAATGNVVFVKKLLDAGADPNVFDNARATPLHEVLRTRYDDRAGKLKQSHQDVARILISADANVDACDFAEETPLECGEKTRVLKPFNPNNQNNNGGDNQQQQGGGYGYREPIDDEIVKMMRQRHSSRKASSEVIAARWAALVNCCSVGKY